MTEESPSKAAGKRFTVNEDTEDRGAGAVPYCPDYSLEDQFVRDGDRAELVDVEEENVDDEREGNVEIPDDIRGRGWFFDPRLEKCVLKEDVDLGAQ